MSPRRRAILLIGGSLIAGCLLYSVAVIAEGYVEAQGIVDNHLSYFTDKLTPAALSSEQLHILLSVEDPTFFTHHGLDLRTPGAGMTTLTQGLVKFLYFKRFHPGIAKIRQSLLAIGFDARIDKNTQLTICLTSAYLGNYHGRPVYGFAAAARTYYGKTIAQLGRREYISLVAMLVGPDRFNPVSHPRDVEERVNRIELMLDCQCHPEGWLDVYYDSCAV